MMLINRNLDRWKLFTCLVDYGWLGKSIREKLSMIHEKRGDFLIKVIKVAVETGQIVRDYAYQFPNNYETIREIGKRAFEFGLMSDEEIDELVKKGGWK